MNSGSLKVSSRMFDLSIYFKCILILANMSYSIKILLWGVICYKFVRIVVGSKLCGEQLVLIV